MTQKEEESTLGARKECREQGRKGKRSRSEVPEVETAE